MATDVKRCPPPATLSAPLISDAEGSADGTGVVAGKDNVSQYLNDRLKHVVTSALKGLMQEKPENPMEYLAAYVKRNSPIFKDDVFSVEVPELGCTCQLSNLSKRQRRGQTPMHRQVQNLPVFGVETPTATELQKVIDLAEDAFPNSKTTHLIVELPTVWESLVFCLGAPYATDLPKVLDSHAQSGNSTLSSDVGVGSEAPTEPKPARPTVDEASKKLIAALGRQRRPQSLSELICTLNVRSSALKITLLPTVDMQGTKLFDVLDNSVGLSDNLDLFTPTIVASFRRPQDSRFNRILSICAALLRPVDEVRVFQDLENIINDNTKNVKVFAYNEYQKYWNEVLDRRDRRDKLRAQKEAERKQAIQDARIAAAKEAAAEAAKEAAAKEGGGNIAPHPPTDAGSRSRGGYGKGNTANQSSEPLVLPPLPPPDPAVVERKKRQLQIRANRRQQEDSEFIETLKKTRAQCVLRIQRIFRNWRARARRALMEAEMKEAEQTGVTRPEVEAYREMQQEPAYVGPALIRKAQMRLKTVHGELFSTLPPPPPVPPRRKKYWAPQRARIPASYEDDVSSEDERWLEQVAVLPDRVQNRRSMYFNPFARLRKCDEGAGNETLADAEHTQVHFCGLASLQRRAYRQMCDAVLDLLHIAYVELAHRGDLPSGCPTFSVYLQRFHDEVFSWFSAPHLVASTTDMAEENLPKPRLSGPVNPMTDRLLYVSLDSPVVLPWTADDIEAMHSLRLSTTDTALRYVTRVSRKLYFTPEYLDRGKWVAAVQHLVDDDKHDHILWLSVSENPYLYVNGRPFVVAKRPLRQIVDGALKYLMVEPTVFQRNKPAPLQPVASPTTASSVPGAAAFSSPGVRTSFNSGPRFSRGTGGSSSTNQTPQETPLGGNSQTPTTPGRSLPLVGAAARTFPQFGVSVTEWENAARVELLRAAESNHGNIQFCATRTIAEVFSGKDAAVTAQSGTGVQQQQQVQSQLQSQQQQQHSLVLTAPSSQCNIVVSHSTATAPICNTTDGGDASSAMFGETSPQASPVRLSSGDSFFEGYVTESLLAPEVVTRECSIHPKVVEERPAAGHSGINLVAATRDSGGGSFLKHEFASGGGAGGRSLRKKLGSRQNMDSASQRKSAGAEGNPQRISASGDASGEPLPPITTPHQEAAAIASHETLNKFQFELVRHSIRHCAGPQFLLAYDHFIGTAFAALSSKHCVVVAMPDEEALFFGTAVSLIDGAILSVKSMTLQNQQIGIPSETSVEMPTPPEEASLVSPGKKLLIVDVMPCLSAFYRLVAAATSSVRNNDVEYLTSNFEASLVRCGAHATFATKLSSLKLAAEAGENTKLKQRWIQQACCWVERYCWLILLHVFLAEVGESVVDSAPPSAGSVEIPSFSLWASAPRMESVMQWMVDIDPWSNETTSPDAHHVCYTNIYRRWKDDQYVGVAY